MRLFVVGNVTEDVIFGLERLPEDGETLIAETRISDIGGKGLNQAMIAARCGLRVRLIAPVGRDDAGRRARALVAAEPLEAVLIDKEGPTDQSIIAVSRSGENHIISSAFAASALTLRDLTEAAVDAIAGDLLLMQGNLSRQTTADVLDWGRRKGLVTTVNPSPIRWSYADLWRLIDRLILNRHELRSLTGQSDLDTGIAALRSAGVPGILVTLGAEGAVFSRGARRHAVPAFAAQVVDTAGAGDTFCGAFVTAAHGGMSLERAMTCAARAAAITIGRSGTFSAFPSAAELADLFRLSRETSE